MAIHRHFIVVAIAVALHCSVAPPRSRRELAAMARGPFRRHQPRNGLPDHWDKKSGKNIAWRLPLPGPAGATPVVWDDHIFLTSVDGDDIVLLAADTDGKVLWKRPLDTGNRTVRQTKGIRPLPLLRPTAIMSGR